MAQKHEQLKQAVTVWLDRNYLAGDTHWYDIETWRARGETYHKGAVLVLVFEGGLHYVMNYEEDDELYEELVELANSFGYFFELGYTWSMGFYELELLD